MAVRIKKKKKFKMKVQVNNAMQAKINIITNIISIS